MNESQKRAIAEAQKARWARIKAENKVSLPEGVKIGSKPDLFEMYMKGRGTGDKWITYVQVLKSLSATETLQMDLSGVGDIKKHAKAAVTGIRTTARQMGFHKKVKYALIGNILHITV